MVASIAYALAALIPGLGYWVLGLKRRGLVIAGIFAVSLLGLWLSLQMPYQWLMDLALNCCISIWVVQLLITIDSISLKYRQTRNPGKAAIIPQKQYDHGNPATRPAHRVVLAQAGVSDINFIAAFQGYHVPRMNLISLNDPFQFVYVGLTIENLIIIDADKLGMPMLVESLPCGNVKVLFDREKWWDVLEIQVDGEDAIRIRYDSSQYDEVETIYSHLCARTANGLE